MALTRDVEGDYRNAYIAQHEGLLRAERNDEAAVVAQILREQYGHEVDSPKTEKAVEPRALRERADRKAPEAAVDPKPQPRS